MNKQQSKTKKIPETGTEMKDEEVENQTKKLEREENIAYTTENIKNDWNNSTEKYGKNFRVQHFEESIEDVVAVEIRSIQAKVKQEEYDEVTKEVSNSQVQKETIGDG